ncbi:hypothetical protein [Blastococcus saxobsidens]|uniref:Antibiotic biosynthesis monooxygenase n=1 Tax=Blastococcus saxobsidens TaxID=138336 RepID=A0A4Q7Y7I0_9ACTN|nr:hypothetical protein [Blastococcus saxobsidens]RZU32524.1 hypothetical protein BKA19_2219 [Blastococcus saxobsidens]
MHARSTTIVGDPQRLDPAIDYVRDRVLPEVAGMEGFVGLSMLTDRPSACCITTTAWEDADAVQRSAPHVRVLRQRLAEILRGVPRVERWEIAVLHRLRPTGEGACSRVVWTRGDPAHTDRRIHAFRTGVLPQLEELPGFCSVSVLIDRPTGRAATAVTYASREAMTGASERTTAIQDRFTEETGLRVRQTSEYDVAVAKLRVPETV